MLKEGLIDQNKIGYKINDEMNKLISTASKKLLNKLQFEEKQYDNLLEGIQVEITKTLLWNVDVLYIGTRVEITKSTEETGGIMSTQTDTSTKKSEIKTVTLAVTPEDSEKLVFTEETGSVWLALLPADGIEREETPGRTFENIFE